MPEVPRYVKNVTTFTERWRACFLWLWFIIQEHPVKETSGYIIHKIYKTDRCAVGCPLSVILVDVHMIWIGNEVVKAMSAPVYKRFIQQKEFSTLYILLDRKIILNNEDIVTRMVCQSENKKL